MSKSSFFRQSGWMMIAMTVSGAFMWSVHKAATLNVGGARLGMADADYAVFLALLQVINAMSIPQTGLQLTFVQQAVVATGGQKLSELAGAFRALLKASFLFWLACAVAVFVVRQPLAEAFKLGSTRALWATAAVGLASLWSPILLGMMQGQQNFLWLGIAQILNGFTRLATVAVFVLLLGGRAAAAMTAAFLGMFVAMLIGAWQTRSVWRVAPAKFLWKPWLKRVLPVTLGYGAATYMLSLDMIVVQVFFPKDPATAYYGAAGTMGRAVFFFLAPLTIVMFPKIVQSAAKSETTSVLAQAVGITTLLGIGAAMALTLLPELPLRIMYNADFLVAAPMLPWFAWCMLPLPIANVLVNNLLARERYAVVPWLIAVATAYFFALKHVALRSAADLQVYDPLLDQVMVRPAVAGDFTGVIQTLGAFGLMMLVICLFFTWLSRAKADGQKQAVA